MTASDPVIEKKTYGDKPKEFSYNRGGVAPLDITGSKYILGDQVYTRDVKD